MGEHAKAQDGRCRHSPGQRASKPTNPANPSKARAQHAAEREREERQKHDKPTRREGTKKPKARIYGAGSMDVAQTNAS